MAAWLALASPVALEAVTTTDNAADSLGSRVLVSPSYRPSVELAEIDTVRTLLAPATATAWTEFIALSPRTATWRAQVDQRSGLVEIAEGAGIPWIPGHGNRLDRPQEPDIDVLERLARDFVANHEGLLGTSSYQLRLRRPASGQIADHVWFVEFDVFAGGLEIAGARLFFRVNNGNLIQFGAERVPAPGTIAPVVYVTEEQARSYFESYVGFTDDRDRLVGKSRLLLLPAAVANDDFTLGEGYELRPVWEFTFRRGDQHPTWRGRIDAETGDIVEFIDVNRYSQVTGGYWPVSWKVGGVPVNQVSTGWPFTTVTPQGATTSTSGLYTWDGNPQSAYHFGPYVSIVDQCAGAAGTAPSDGAGNIDFGTFDPPDGSTPGDCSNQLGIGDNTPAARQQYWHVNKIMEKARTYFPANPWPQSQLGVNVNINLTCNAFWNGSTLNFYRTNGSCYNLGANAGVSMHEWGHGMDSNDGNGSSIDNGTGETYGDFTAALQTLDSCIGNGILMSGTCGGYGNPCVAGGCDGVRDIDWGRHTNNTPMTVANFTQPICPSDNGGGYNGPCGNGAPVPDDKEGHCESYVSSGALWDLAAADLRAGCSGRNAGFPDWDCPGAGGPYNEAGAWSVVDRLWYLSRPTANQAFTCSRTSPTWTSDGCNAGSNWKAMRAIDDDDGNLANGTPHACQIAAAFNRHGIGNTAGSSCAGDVTACFRGCPQPPTPTLGAPVSGNNRLTLDWTPDPTPDVTDIFRNEIGCSAGFTKVADNVSGTLYVDDQVANGTTYYYQVVRHPIGNESCASPPSNCVSAAPAAAPSAKYLTDSAFLAAVPNDTDSDGFVDNCETGEIQFGIVNDGVGDLTNVRFTITSPDPEVAIATAMPVSVGDLPETDQTAGLFEFTLDGATCGQTVFFDVEVTADEMSGSTFDTFTHGPVEQDIAAAASRTDDFETGDDGWTFVEGYGRENITADSGTWSVHSSSGLDDRLDAALSPIFRRGAGATQVVIAERHDIEAPHWDRANVHAIRLSDGTHTLLTPTGRTYTAGGPWNPVGHVGTEPGWADTNTVWGDATFDLSGLTVGESYRLEINYNTDASVTATGHWFDNVRWTDVSFQVCDTQNDPCVTCTPPDPPTGLTATASGQNEIRLDWVGVSPTPVEYRIYRSTTSGGPNTQVGVVSGTTVTFTDSGLTPGETYYYVVRSWDDCVSAASNEASAQAFGDCDSPPSFAGMAAVEPLSGNRCGLRLSWSPGVNQCGNDALVYNVYRSTTPGFTPGPANLHHACVTGTSFDDTSVANATTYHYIVQAEDATVGGGGACRSGNQDANGVELSGSSGGTGNVELYSNDFEAGTGFDDWTTGSFGGTAGTSWRGIQTCAAHSGSDVFRFGGTTCSANYLSNKFQYAQPAGANGIAVPVGATGTTLSFFHRRQFETDFDGGLLALSLDGSSYTLVPSTAITGTNYNGTLQDASAGCSPLAGATVFTGTEIAFTESRVDLDAVCDTITAGSGGCAGQDVYIGFTAITDCSLTQDGWFLDNVVVTIGGGPACDPAPDRLSFLTATARDGENVLEWLNPSSGDYASTMIRWSTTAFPAEPTDGTLLVDQNDGLGNKGTATHSSLTNGQTYYYSAFVDGGSGAFSGRKTVTARPFDGSGDVEWAYSTGASGLGALGVGSVYGVSDDRVLHSIDTSGTGTWPAGWQPTTTQDAVHGAPTIESIPLLGASKVAFVGSQDGHVYAFDADSGQELWASPALAPTGSLLEASPAGSFAALGGLDRLMIGTRHLSADNQLHGLDVADGSVAWSFTNSVAQGGDGTGIGAITATAVLDLTNDRVYFTSRPRAGGSPDTVWCLSFSAGSVTKLWSRAIGDSDTTPTLFGGRLYVGTSVGEAHALDPATGADLWSAPFDAGDGPIGTIAPRPGSAELLFSTDGSVWSISDGGTNAIFNWSEAGIPSPSNPLVPSTTARAWVGGGDGRLYDLDFSGGAPVSTFDVLGDGTAAVGSPVLGAGGGRIYLATAAGQVYSVALPAPGCSSDPACDDGAFCNGAETCNVGTGQCEAGTPPVCDDGAFCNGTETCNEGTDSCDPGTPPVCDDGMLCNGREACNEGSDSCETATPPVSLFGDDFELGGTGAWDITRNPQGDLSVDGAGALEGALGLSVHVDHSSSRKQRQHYVATTHEAVPNYCWSFLFDPNSIQMPDGKLIRIWGARSDDGFRLLDMAVRAVGGSYSLAVQVRKDGGSHAGTSFVPMGDAAVLIGGEWSNTPEGGVLRLFIDGALVGEVTGITNVTRLLSTPGMGNLGQFRRGTLGDLRFDLFTAGWTP